MCSGECKYLVYFFSSRKFRISCVRFFFRVGNVTALGFLFIFSHSRVVDVNVPSFSLFFRRARPFCVSAYIAGNSWGIKFGSFFRIAFSFFSPFVLLFFRLFCFVTGNNIRYAILLLLNDNFNQPISTLSVDFPFALSIAFHLWCTIVTSLCFADVCCPVGRDDLILTLILPEGTSTFF